MDRGEALAQRLFQATLHSLELAHVWLGDRLGLYAALSTRESTNSVELAKAAGIAERYAREWLEQQAVAGILDVAQPDDDPKLRGYRLPAEHREVLLDPDSLRHSVPMVEGAIGAIRGVGAVRDVFRTGAGLPYETWADDLGNSTGNRPMFVHQLAQEWLPQVPDVYEGLTAGTITRVADIGCGNGWSSIALARAFPQVQVDAVDLSADAITRASDAAVQAGVNDRVTFYCGEATALTGEYDLAFAFECLHDMSDPAGALRAVRGRLAPNGVLLVAEERNTEPFTAPGSEVDRFHYGWSSLHCLPASMAQQPSAALGTSIRPSAVHALGTAAGFRQVQTLPIEHDMWLFFRLTP